MHDKKDISIVVPLYNEEESLKELCEWISRVIESHGFTYEILLIDDGSNDSSWQVIKELAAINNNIIGSKFNRNCGKSAALNLGFAKCKGDVVITMDADLQDSPDEIPALYKMITEENYDLVSGWKKRRHDPISKTVPSKFFNLITRIFSGIKLHDFNCGLKAYKNGVVKSVEVYGEMHRYIPLLAKWKGFTRIGEKTVEHHKRKYGHTKFGLERFLNGFLDLLSVSFVTRFSRRPMHLFGTLGTLSFLAGFIFIAKLVWDKIDAIYISKMPVKREIVEQPIFYLALVALIVGVQLFLTGFISEMLAMRRNSEEDYLVIESVGD